MSGEIEKLIERVEAATGSDREIDTDLCLALSYIGSYEKPLNLRRAEDEPGWLDYEADEDADGRLVDCTDAAPRLTDSIDAALALVERVLPDRSRAMHLTELITPSGSRRTTVTLLVGSHEPDKVSGSSATPCLAIILATLRALSSKAGT